MKTDPPKTTICISFYLALLGYLDEHYRFRDFVRFSKPVVPLLKSTFSRRQFRASYKVNSKKSGGAMAPLAPLLTKSLD